MSITCWVDIDKIKEHVRRDLSRVSQLLAVAVVVVVVVTTANKSSGGGSDKRA